MAYDNDYPTEPIGGEASSKSRSCATGRQAMNRITAIRVADAIAIFLVAHLALYGFTGLALWGVNIEFGQGFALVMLHVVGLFAPMIARELRWQHT